MANVDVYSSREEYMKIVFLKGKTKVSVFWQSAKMICLLFYKQTQTHLITSFTEHHYQL